MEDVLVVAGDGRSGSRERDCVMLALCSSGLPRIDEWPRVSKGS